MRYIEIELPGTYVKLSLFDRNRKEAHAILMCEPTHDVKSQFINLINAVKSLSSSLGMDPVFKRYFLSDAANQSHLLPESDSCACSIVQQPPLNGAKAACLAIFQEKSSFSEMGMGIWKDNSGRIWQGDNHVVDNGDAETMTMQYFDCLKKILAASGGSIKDHCLRTWFFVRDIDNNYSGVVSGRNRFFASENLTDKTNFIASTGIEGQSAYPKQLVLFNAFADTSIKKDQVKYLQGKTHMNPTYEYGVAFERGTSVDYGDRRHVYISGTASIGNKGEVISPFDIVAQSERMLENISVLLSEADCTWDDVAHMIVYLRDIADHNVVAKIMNERLPNIPKVVVLAPICRPSWLIETECFAIKEIHDCRYNKY